MPKKRRPPTLMQGGFRRNTVELPRGWAPRLTSRRKRYVIPDGADWAEISGRVVMLDFVRSNPAPFLGQAQFKSFHAGCDGCGGGGDGCGGGGAGGGGGGGGRGEGAGGGRTGEDTAETPSQTNIASPRLPSKKKN